MTHPHQEHNTLSAIRGFLENIANEELTDVPDKVRTEIFFEDLSISGKVERTISGSNFTDLASPCGTREAIPNPNRIVNDNQTWKHLDSSGRVK